MRFSANDLFVKLRAASRKLFLVLLRTRLRASFPNRRYDSASAVAAPVRREICRGVRRFSDSIAQS